MFTGIIEHLGAVSRLETGAAGGKLTIHAPSLAHKLAVSASIAVNGCCLTITQHDHDHFSADLSPETLAKTSFPSLKPGARVNLEQPLVAGKEFGGHFVLGHVDTTGSVAHLKQDGNSWFFGVHIPAELAPYMVSKGSITIDGISLTVATWQNSIAEIALIPYTYDHTNIRDRAPGDPVNLEADVLAKYIDRYTRNRNQPTSAAPLRLQDLIQQGF
ncbi:MAG TPA: riboflavin synthase [Candidatus Acidoferrum sp.]|nr:riboflavin synthase [Candidatus Acidoferrum sp.]